jgi:hypothetical protein
MSFGRPSRGGSQIAELAPALLILFIVILFPMLDVMYLGLGYCCGWYLNHMSVRACATVEPTLLSYQAACDAMTAQWSASSLSNFTGATVVQNKPDNPVPPTGKAENQTNALATVRTQVKVNPFFTVPMMSSIQVDGVTRPIIFKYTDSVPMQESGNN